LSSFEILSDAAKANVTWRVYLTAERYERWATG
jgi:hypothetical protein